MADAGAPGRLVEVAGERIHLVERGAGRPLLLLHGYPSNATAWRAVGDRLTDAHSLIAPDQMGFGWSSRRARLPLDGAAYADRAVALLDALGLDRVDVAGLSWGGGTAQRLAVRHPDRVDRLVLIASVHAGHRLWLGGGDVLGIRLARRLPGPAHAVVAWALRSAARASGIPAAELAAAYLDPLQLPGTVAFLRRFVRATRETEPIAVAAIRAPTLVIVPQRDRVVLPGIGRRLAREIPGAEYRPVPGAGHMVQFQEPERVARLMRRFLAR